MKTSVPRSLHGVRKQARREEEPARPQGSRSLLMGPCAHKATGRGCETAPAEPERVLAGLGGRAACGAPAAPAAPTMCRQAGCGAPAGAPLPPAAHQGPRRVRKQPRSVSVSSCGLGFGDRSSRPQCFHLSHGRWACPVAAGGCRQQEGKGDGAGVLEGVRFTTALPQLAGFSVVTVLWVLLPCLAQ